jgi:putative peptidoglycan lipid II flippase
MREESKTQSTVATVIVMTSTFVSRILGFLRTAVITAVFGATGKADIINVTFAVPNNLRKLMAEGALSSAFIPVLSEAIVQEGESRERSRRVVRNLIGFQLLVIIPICIVSIIFSEELIRFVLTQFDDPEKLALSASLFRYFITYLLFISVSAVFIGLLNSHRRFFIPAITPIIFSIAVILSILLLHERMGVFSMAVGVILGGAGQVIFQYPLFRSLGYTLKPSFIFANEDFRRIMRQWLPVLATSSVFALTQQVAFILASGLETGSASSLSYALVFWQLPFGIFSASITTVLFPKMSRQAAQDDTAGLRDSVQFGIRFLLVVLVPSALVLGVLGKEIISVAIQRGMFHREDTLLTARVLRGYCYGLFGVGAFNFLQRFFYASKNYRLPFIVGAGVSALDIALSIILKETPLRVVGLSVANSISFSLGFLVLIYLAYRLLGEIDGIEMVRTAGKVLAASIPAYAVMVVSSRIAGPYWTEGSSFLGLGILLLQLAAVTGVYFGLYKLFRVEMIDYILKKRRPAE